MDELVDKNIGVLSLYVHIAIARIFVILIC